VQFCSAASTSAGGATTTASARMSAAARLWRDAVERQWSVPRWVVLEAPTDSGGAGGAILE
uniref:SGNH/GDSL hydrolase family protein n=1 Tax=Globodera pallida TaxID=36090 RepID=A0A183CT92_GLOPA